MKSMTLFIGDVEVERVHEAHEVQEVQNVRRVRKATCCWYKKLLTMRPCRGSI